MRSRSSARRFLGSTIAIGVAVTVFGYMAGSAPAGNRNPPSSFAAFPGPSKITFGKNVAYKSSLANISTSTYKRVSFIQTIPSVKLSDDSTIEFADLVYSSCEPNGPPYSGLTATSYACPTIDTFPPGSSQSYTLVWKSKSTLPPGATCKTNPCELTTTGTWLIKEGLKNSGGNDTFAIPATTTLLDVPDPAQAGAYAIKACTDASDPTLFTNKVLTDTNKGYTSVCVPQVPGLPLDPGSVVTINEYNDTNANDPGFTEIHQVCIAAAGLTCPNDQNPAQFPIANRPTFVFVFNNRAYKGRPISQMFREIHPASGDSFWQPVSSNPADPYYCLLSKGSDITTATCQGTTNSHWRGG
jgi:hypothetical protein